MKSSTQIYLHKIFYTLWWWRGYY